MSPRTPLQFVLKVASRCNLNCSYCYVYNKGDETWRSRPSIMPAAVVTASVDRIRRYCEASGQTVAPIVFHGDAGLTAALTAEQMRTAMLVSLKVYRRTFSVSLPMFALFDVFLGYLILRSRYVPRVFGVFFLVAGSAWII